MYRVTTIGGVAGVLPAEDAIAEGLSLVGLNTQAKALGAGLVVGLLLGAIFFRRR